MSHTRSKHRSTRDVRINPVGSSNKECIEKFVRVFTLSSFCMISALSAGTVSAAQHDSLLILPQPVTEPFIYKNAEVTLPLDHRSAYSTAHEALEPIAGTLSRQSAITPPAATQHVLRITPSDRSLSRAMKRFLEDYGWQMSWEIEHDFPIRYSAEFRGDVLEIAEQVADALQNADTPIRLVAYRGNNVLRVLYATH